MSGVNLFLVILLVFFVVVIVWLVTCTTTCQTSESATQENSEPVLVTMESGFYRIREVRKSVPNGRFLSYWRYKVIFESINDASKTLWKGVNDDITKWIKWQEEEAHFDIDLIVTSDGKKSIGKIRKMQGH